MDYAMLTFGVGRRAASRRNAATNATTRPAKGLREHVIAHNGLYLGEPIVDMQTHNLSDLFAQLGLPSDAAAIESFISAHSPLPEAIRLHEAPFWTPAQAAFLREEFLDDADWAEAVDELNVRLRAKAWLRA